MALVDGVSVRVDEIEGVCVPDCETVGELVAVTLWLAVRVWELVAVSDRVAVELGDADSLVVADEVSVRVGL